MRRSGRPGTGLSEESEDTARQALAVGERIYARAELGEHRNGTYLRQATLQTLVVREGFRPIREPFLSDNAVTQLFALDGDVMEETEATYQFVGPVFRAWAFLRELRNQPPRDYKDALEARLLDIIKRAGPDALVRPIYIGEVHGSTVAHRIRSGHWQTAQGNGRARKTLFGLVLAVGRRLDATLRTPEGFASYFSVFHVGTGSIDAEVLGGHIAGSHYKSELRWSPGRIAIIPTQTRSAGAGPSGPPLLHRWNAVTYRNLEARVEKLYELDWEVGDLAEQMLAKFGLPRSCPVWLLRKVFVNQRYYWQLHSFMLRASKQRRWTAYTLFHSRYAFLAVSHSRRLTKALAAFVGGYCVICARGFRSAEVLKSHLHDLHPETAKVFTCEVEGCSSKGKPQASQRSLKEHNRMYHSDTPTVEVLVCNVPGCEEEGRQFVTRATLNRHNKRFHSEAAEALVCHVEGCPHFGVSLPSQSSLDQHNIAFHSDAEGVFTCKVDGCPSKGRAFASRGTLNGHNRESHPEEAKIFACNVDGCKSKGKRLKDSRSLRRHNNDYHSPAAGTFKCTVRGCVKFGVSLSSKRSLQRHNRTIHKEVAEARGGGPPKKKRRTA